MEINTDKKKSFARKTISIILGLLVAGFIMNGDFFKNLIKIIGWNIALKLNLDAGGTFIALVDTTAEWINILAPITIGWCVQKLYNKESFKIY